jgi:hypothetical protein
MEDKWRITIDLKIMKKSRYEFVFDFMQHISGLPRTQMRFSALEVTISLDNEVRFIDAFTYLASKKCVLPNV